jgi:hypothetical protein
MSGGESGWGQGTSELIEGDQIVGHVIAQVAAILNVEFPPVPCQQAGGGTATSHLTKVRREEKARAEVLAKSVAPLVLLCHGQEVVGAHCRRYENYK